jgi:hypothetical protein
MLYAVTARVEAMVPSGTGPGSLRADSRVLPVFFVEAGSGADALKVAVQVVNPYGEADATFVSCKPVPAAAAEEAA